MTLNIEDWYLVETININTVKPNKDWSINLLYIEPKWITRRYKVNKDWLFEEVKEN